MATRVCDSRSEEFEPMCKWKKDECSNIVEIDLQGFKKEQLKVMINHCAGILSITGERPLEKSTMSCFRKEIKVSDDIKINEIRAKFSCGVLTITMPKKPPPVPELSQHCKQLVPADHEGLPSLIDFGNNVVTIKPDENSAAKYMAVGGIVGMVTFLVLAGACCCIKYYQMHCKT